MIAPENPSGEELLALRCDVDHYEHAVEKIAALAADISEAIAARRRDWYTAGHDSSRHSRFYRPDLDERLLPGLTEALRIIQGDV